MYGIRLIIQKRRILYQAFDSVCFLSYKDDVPDFFKIHNCKYSLNYPHEATPC